MQQNNRIYNSSNSLITKKVGHIICINYYTWLEGVLGTVKIFGGTKIVSKTNNFIF